MRIKISFAAVPLTCMALACAIPAGLAQAKERPAIAKAERALDMLEVQNVMSKHAYYHGAGKNCEELDALWVKKAPEPTFSNPRGSWVGMNSIRASYCEANLDNQKKELEALKTKYPEIKDGRENYGVGSWLIHTLTTPIIEVAGDGKSAKAMWYSPGATVNATPDGKASGIWFFEKYGVDFLKEGGQWKIWHIQMYYDMTGPLEKGFADVPVRPTGPVAVEAGERAVTDPRMEMNKKNPKPYKDWSPTTVPEIVKMPEPYYTFSETFSY
jgi:hypothetical protein